MKTQIIKSNNYYTNTVFNATTLNTDRLYPVDIIPNIGTALMIINQLSISMHGSQSSFRALMSKSRRLMCVTVAQPSDGSGGLGGDTPAESSSVCGTSS